MQSLLRTPATELFGVRHPVILAGMNVSAGPDLAAAVTNAGGLGVIGGVGYTPAFLRAQIRDLKESLEDKNAPFGIDLLLPQVGGSARKTNKDYTNGKLDELISVVIEEKAALFVSAVGVPPRYIVDRLHAAGIPVMLMVGAPKHALKGIAAGVDLICAQGGEAGGHTGDIASSILVPACVDAVRGHNSPLTGKPIQVIAAGGIFDGRGLASALAAGATAVWVGTRFICAEEAGAPRALQNEVLATDHNGTMRTLIYSGRPMRVKRTGEVAEWEDNRFADIKKLTSQGIVPVPFIGEVDVEGPKIMGQVAAMVHEILPAKVIVEEMVKGAVKQLSVASGYVVATAKL